jgi:hypothetical protein
MFIQMDKHLLAYYIGIFIIFASHIFMLSMQKFDLSSISTQHNIVNLFAGLTIAYYFMNKEKFINF